MTAVDPYQWWRNALAGQKGPIRDGEPQAGFYKMRRVRGGPWLPVAIFPDANGTLFARVGPEFAEVVDPKTVWLSVADHPVSDKDAHHAAKHGHWPGELPPIETPAPTPSEEARRGIGGNNPPREETDEQALERIGTPSEKQMALLQQLTQATAEAKEWFAKTPIQTKEHADTAANWCDRLSALNKDVDEERMRLRRPFLSVLERIQNLFKPVQDDATSLARKLDEAARKWAKEEERRLAEEARRKAEEARRQREEEERRLREEHERKLKEQGINPENAPPPPPPPMLPLEETPVEPQRVMVGGASGRRRGARSAKKEIRIVDIEKLLLHLKNHPDIIKLATKIAEVQAIKGGIDVPGVKIVDPDEEEAAA